MPFDDGYLAECQKPSSGVLAAGEVVVAAVVICACVVLPTEMVLLEVLRVP